MTKRPQKAALLAVFPALLTQAAQAQTNNSRSDSSSSIFSNAGQGGHWIEQFFPYSNPKLDGIHEAIGQMLSIYNTGILVLAGILTLYAVFAFVIDSAHTGKVGGNRHSALYGPLRLVVALSLLVPMGSGYNGAQIVAIKLAQSGSGLANSVWKKFVPTTASYDFTKSSFAAGNVDAFLQQALINESCLAATQLDQDKDAQPGTLKIQALYPNAAHTDHPSEGAEFPLTVDPGKAGIDVASAYGSIATEAQVMGRTARQIRIHYNRVGNDDYCGSLDLPVPLVPQEVMLDPTDQTAYAAAYLAIRPELAAYAQKLATAIDAAVKAHNAPSIVAPASGSESSLAYLPTDQAPLPPPVAPAAPTAPPQIEVPKVELPVTAWDALIDQFNTSLTSATDDLQHKYIDNVIEQDSGEQSDQDWVWAGSLFFKLTKLSHDDLKLRFGRVSASLPNPQILPAEMRDDGMLASCPDLRSDVFLPDYHCRISGRETTLIIKTADDILHTMQSQRSTDSLPAIDAGPNADRKGDLLAGNLIAAARLDAVIGALAQNQNPASPKAQGHFNAMFDAVNIGNALYLSASSLFHASSMGGSTGNGVSSAILSLFACVILVPGFFLAVYLPLLPALRFFLGIATWLITVFEALVALPLIALVQLRTTGEGILPHGRQGLFLLLQMLLRPALMILGLMAAIVIFDALYGFITWAIWSGLLHVTGDAGQFGAGIEGMLELTGYLMFWSLLIYFAANISFNAITAIPDRILLWVGAADMGTNVQVTAAPNNSPAPAVVTGGAAPAGLAGAQPATMITGGGMQSTMQQIGQFGGPSGVQSASSGDSAPMGANMDHFPKVIEVHVPDNPTGATGPVVVNTTGTREISGKPKAPPRETTDFVPPVQGGEK